MKLYKVTITIIALELEDLTDLMKTLFEKPYFDAYGQDCINIETVDQETTQSERSE